MGWQPETQPKGKPPVEKTKGKGKMQRLIDAQDTFNVLSDYYHHSTHVQHLALQEALNKVPTAQPKRGKWEMKPDPFGFFDEILVCSECGCTTKMREKTLYCPHCGARMDERKEE